MDPSQVLRGPYEFRRIVRVEAPNGGSGACEVLKCSVGLAGTFVGHGLAIQPSRSTVKHDNRCALAGKTSIRLSNDNVVGGDLVSELDRLGFRAVPARGRLGRHFRPLAGWAIRILGEVRHQMAQRHSFSLEIPVALNSNRNGLFIIRGSLRARWLCNFLDGLI